MPKQATPPPLFVAAECGDIETLRTLLSGQQTFAGIVKCNANPIDGDGFTPVMVAAACGHEECVAALLEAGACPSQ